MKKVIRIMGLCALVALAATSCKKEEHKLASSFKAELTQPTSNAKTHLSGSDLHWNSGDAIKVFDNAGTAYLLSTTDNNVKEATFTGETTLDASESYAAFYPAAGATLSGTEVLLGLPAVQTYAEGTFGNATYPMAATNTGTSFTFHSPCGLLAIPVKGTGNIGTIELTGKASENLAGQLRYNLNGEHQGLTNGQATVTLDCGNIALDATNATTFYFVVPAGVFANGFKAVLKNGATELYTLETMQDNTIAAETIKLMPVVTVSAVAVTTDPIANVGYTDATVNGSYVAPTGMSVTEVGFYFGTDATSMTTKVQATLAASFSHSFDGLTEGTTYYYMAYFSKLSDSADYIEQAASISPDYCFPNRLEDAIVLETITELPFCKDARAPYYLGCLYYDKRQYDLAVDYWERSAKLDPSFPTVWRNLALARFNKQNQKDEAVEYMELAFHLDETDARMLMELDQLYKRMQRPHQERLDFLRKYPDLIAQRDDLVLEEITLLNQLGRYEEAMQKLDAHQFHPWEGGEGKVPAQYQICRVELAKQAIAAKDYDKAIRLLQECLEYPHHLGEGKLYGAQENDFYYLLGIAYDALGNKDKAVEAWEQATRGPQEPAAAMYYNDAKPDKIFYQGMALLKLGREGEAHGRFYRLINYGKQHVFEHQTMDYFAVSLPDLLIWDDSLDTKNEIHCKYMLALGYYGMGDKEKALRYLAEVEAIDNNHQGIQQFRTLIDTFIP